MLLLLSLAAWASGPGDAVAQAIRQAVALREGVAVEDVQVSGLGALPELPEAEDWAITFATGGNHTGTVRVVARAGTRRYALLPQVVVWRTVPVAARDVAPGERVPLRMARTSSDTMSGPSVDDATAWVARVPLPAGTALSPFNVRQAPDLSRGASVRLQVQTGPVAVSAPGRLLDDAFLGQEVAVLNLATRRVQRGEYRGDLVVSLER